MELPDPGQQLRPSHPRYPLAGHDDADQAPVVPQPGQQAKQLIAGSSTYDLVVSPVPLTKLSLDDTSPSWIAVNDQQDWRIWHARHLWALTGMPTLATTSFPAAALRRAVGGAFGLADVPTGQGCCAGMGSFLVGGVAGRAYPPATGTRGQPLSLPAGD